MRKEKVVVLDDDRASADTLTAILHRTYDVKTFYCPHDFLSYMGKHNDVFAIIADYKMPKLNGIDALDMARKKCTGVVKILTTGVYDINITTRAVNQVHVDYIYLKPFDVRELIAALSKEKNKKKQKHYAKLSIEEVYALTKGMNQINEGL